MGSNERTGGRILVDQLRLHGVDLVFGVPGERDLAALDALYDPAEVRYIVCRQEGGPAMMADAYGKLTARPGVAFAIRGPGASNASAGVHIAQQRGTPLVLLVGQIARETRERDAFQEVDSGCLFGGISPRVAEVDDAARLPELLHRAFMPATSARPGPVVLSLPEDMLTDRAGVPDAKPGRRVEAAPAPEALAELRRLLQDAQRPFVILGGGGGGRRGRQLVGLEPAGEVGGGRGVPPSPTQDDERSLRVLQQRRSSASASGAGAASTRRQGFASGTPARSVSMSSGSDRTTGPGRPEVAVMKARCSSSGRRAASSTSATHFAMPPKKRR